MDSYDLANIAYKKYKQTVYHEQLNLFQKQKLADFECSGNIKEKLKKFALILDTIQNDSSIDNTLLNQHIEGIKFKLLPKTIKTQEEQKQDDFKRNNVYQKNPDEHFLTNVKSSEKYYLEGANFFIDAPVELHLISVIWLMKAGIFLEPELSESCYGSRLNDSLFKSKDLSNHLFKLYNTQYQSWRNNALEKAEKILTDEKSDVAIFSLDFKQCFYCINTDFDEIHTVLEKKIKNVADRQFAQNLTKIVEKIHIKYKEVIQKFFRTSHRNIPDHIFPLPVGLASSSLLCNWHLKEFDNKVLRILKPDYYGRYVDDILIVIRNPIIESDNRIRNFMKRYFCDTNIFYYDSKMESYFLNPKKILQIQEKKLNLHFFTVDHSHALIESFKQKIDENSSAFFFLPDDDLQYYINKTAYNILFNGSTNKWRNIIGIVENVTELSKNLTKIITGLTQSKIDNDNLKSISDQLFKFYKGKNFISFCRTWEKLFSFTIMTNQQKESAIFFFDVQETIFKISIFFPEDDCKYQNCNLEYSQKVDKEILQHLKRDLSEYLLLAISIPVALLGTDQGIYLDQHLEESINRNKSSKISNQQTAKISRYAKKFRQSNLIQHNYIAYPLINYTTYESSLLDWDRFETSFTAKLLKLDENKLNYSPRFIHFDEYYLFQFLQQVLQGVQIDHNSLEKKYNEISHVNKNFPVSIRKNERLSITDRDETIEIIEYCIPKKYSMLDDKPTGKIKVGVANIKITDDDVNKSYYENEEPNLTFERQKEIFSILNQAKKRKCDLLVLPELSIPYRWLPFLVKYARNHQMALIFGMEYWKVKKERNIAYNFIVTALPVKNKDKYKTCSLSIRCKNHYAPKEIANLNEQKLNIPEKSYSRYDLFKWRGCQFSIYNCYEVSDIKHRAIFKSNWIFLLLAY